jgi:hypothetical protein
MSITTNINKAARSVEKAVTGEEPAASLLDTLKEEHEMVAGLLKKLVDSDSGSERKSLLKQVKAALVPHARAEEKILYDAIIALKDSGAKQDGHEGYEEHSLADKTIADLDKIESAVSPEFGAAAKVLKELIEHHVKEEEDDVWKDAKKHFSSDELKLMNQKYLAEKAKVQVK